MAAEKKEATEKTATDTPSKKRLSREESRCRIEGCKRPYRAKGYCNVHYKAWRQGEIEGHRPRYKTCSKEGCRKPTIKWGLCDEHFQARRSGGEEAAPTPAATT